MLTRREMETRLGIANRLAACVADPRAPERVIRSMVDMLRLLDAGDRRRLRGRQRR